MLVWGWVLGWAGSIDTCISERPKARHRKTRSNTNMMASASLLICAEVKEPLHVIGKGAYGEVVEMTYFGISVAGKRLHPAFFTPTPTNEEVQGIRELFQNECTRYI